MFAKNNKHELMKKNADRKVRYGIRKLGIGVVSVALSTLFFISNASQVQADVTDSVTNGQLQASEESPTPSEEGLSAEPEGMFEEEENPVPVQPTLEFKDASSLPQSVPTAGAVIPDTEITSWELKGYGDQKFGAVSFTAPVIEPVIGVQKYPRQPHQVYGTDLYAQITVSREDKTIYQKSFTGTDSSSSTDFYEEYQPGDVLSIYHAEPSRISAEQAELLGTALKNAKTYSYRIHEEGLENITDYVELKKEVAKFYADSQKITLAPQKDLSDVAVIRQGIEQDPYLSKANRTELLAEIAKVEETFQNLPGAILPGQGKQVAIFSVPASTITDQEGRPMGRNMDRQALGITLKEGATIRVRVTSAKETEAKNLVVQLIDSDTQKMVNKAVTLDGDWLEVTALADSVAYIKSPTTGDFQVEYEVVSGRIDELPVFTSETDQKQVEKQWDKFKVPYALIVGNNVQIQAPYKDLDLISQKNLGNLLSQYDQIFKEYYSLTNLRANENGVLQIPRYFAAADINGVGAAYYDSSRWIGSNGTSIGPYLNIGWLTLHEIAHGFEIPSATMPIVEIFNNVYGTLYQAKYIYPTNEEFTKSAWIYGRNRERAVERMVDAVESGKGYQGAEYSTRLLMLMNLADYHDNGGQDFRAFNQYHQELVAQGKPANDLGKDWVELFLNQYGINLVDYFDNLGVKLDSSTRLNALQSNKAVAVMLYQVVGENDLPQAMDALGWTDKQLKNKTSLITTADLAKLDLKVDTTLSLANYQALAGKQLAIMDGDRVVKTINGDDLIANQGSVALSQVPVGGYTLKVLDNALQVADPYITIKSGMPNQLQTAVTTTLLPEVEALYTDSSHTTVKPILTQAQLEAAQSLVDRIENSAIKQLNQALITQAQPDVEEITLKGYGNQTFATINKNEGSDKLVLQTLPGKPQPFYGINDYVTVEVFDDNGKLLYQRSFKGNEDLVASSIEIPVQEYYQVKVSHKEGASRLVTKLDDQVVIPEKVSSFTVVDGHLMADNTLFIQDGLRGRTPQFEVGELTQPSDLIKAIKARVNDTNGKTYTNANFTVENLDVNTPGSYTAKVTAEVVINGMKRTVEQAYPVVITGIASSEESESDTNPSASSAGSVPSQSPASSLSEELDAVPSETSAESVPSETSTSEPSATSEEVPSETTPESVPSETSTSGPSEASEEVPSETTPESSPSETPTLEPSEASDAVPSEITPESSPSETSTSEPSATSEEVPSEITPESVPSETSTSGSSEALEVVSSETMPELVPSESPMSEPSESSDVTSSETSAESVPSETSTSGPSESSEEVPSETMPESVPSETTTSGPSESSDVTPSETMPESVPSETTTSGPSESSEEVPSETMPESVSSETSTSGPSESSEEVPSETMPESVSSETSTSGPSESSEEVPSETMPESVPSETSTSEPSETSEVVPSETMPESVPSETSTSGPSESSEEVPSETSAESVPSESPMSGPSESSDVTSSETSAESVPSETTTSGPSESSDVTPSETMPESVPSETTTSEPSESSEEVPSETMPESGPSETTTSGLNESPEEVPSETMPESRPSETSTTPAPSATPSANLSESAPSEVPAPVLNEEFSQVAIESKSGHELLSSDEITETSSSEVSSELSNSGEFLNLGQEDTTVEADVDFEKPNGVLLKPVLNQGSEEGILTGIHSKKGLKKIANGQLSFSASDRKEAANAKRQLPQLNEEGTSRKLVEVMVIILMLLIFGQNLRKKSRE